MNLLEHIIDRRETTDIVPSEVGETDHDVQRLGIEGRSYEKVMSLGSGFAKLACLAPAVCAFSPESAHCGQYVAAAILTPSLVNGAILAYADNKVYGLNQVSSSDQDIKRSMRNKLRGIDSFIAGTGQSALFYSGVYFASELLSNLM